MDDFERRRELRRQKREEMRLEAERLSYQRNDDDEEEAARERRRRARQERLRQKEEGDLSGEVTEKSEVNAQNSVAEEETKRTTTTGGTDDEAALLERLARREERRQKRLQEALERQKEFDPTITDGNLSLPSRREVNNVEENETAGKEEKAETRRRHYETEETETKSYQRNNWRQDGEEEEKKEESKEEVQEEKPKEIPVEENQVKDDKDKGKAPKEEMKSVWDRKKGVPEQKAQNGEREVTAPKLKSTENAFGRSNLKGAEEFEKLKEKQQEAAAELDELKKKREERRKVLEEEEQKKKQEEAERKVREEEEKRRMKEEIERRRAEAAEKRQKMPEDGVSEDKKPFKSAKGSSLKIEERAEFLNKSAQKSGVKPAHAAAVVSKIDSRLEQYTSAIEGTKAGRPAKPAPSDLPVPAEGVRNIKSMWEKGNVFSSPSGTGTPNKETAGLKVGVSSRINEWLTKTPESKSSAPKPSDLKPGDVSGKRNLWEKQSVDKPSPSKVSAMGKKSETNAGVRQFEKEP